jgi:hypothetical protein
MRFNPPPNWPVSPGWTPPSDWSPEPSWPPAPAGWQFWIDDSPPGLIAVPGQPPDQGVPWPSHTGRNIMIGIASTIAIVVAVVIGVVVTRDSNDEGAQARSGLPGQLGSGRTSDEDRIRSALSAIEESWNSFDYSTFMSHACSKIRDKTSNSESKFTQQRNERGTVTFAVDSINVDGAFAKVEVTETFSSQDTVSERLDFRKEDDDWKLC